MPSSELDSLALDWLFCILDRSSLLTYGSEVVKGR